MQCSMIKKKPNRKLSSTHESYARKYRSHVTSEKQMDVSRLKNAFQKSKQNFLFVRIQFVTIAHSTHSVDVRAKAHNDTYANIWAKPKYKKMSP